MAVAAFKTYSAGEVLTASDLNSSFSQIHDNGESLGWPATTAKDLDGQELILDVDADTSITADTDDRIDFRVRGADAVQLLDSAGAANEPILELVGSEASAGPGPQIRITRTSASPAAADEIGFLAFRGRDSAANTDTYCYLQGQIVDPTTTAEDGRLVVFTNQAGTNVAMMRFEQGMYTPSATGGDQGLDTINASQVFDDGVLLTCFVLEGATKGKIDFKKWDEYVAQGRGPKRRNSAMRRFANRMDVDLDPAEYAGFWKQSGHLPAMPSPEQWSEHKNKMPVGGLVTSLWETVEVLAVHIDKLNERIKTLESA